MRLLGGMAEGFEQVYRRYGGPIHGYLARLTGDAASAEELCQETFVRYLKHRARLAGRNGTLGAWLYTVATNLARDRRRRATPEPLAAEPAGAPAPDAVEAKDTDARVRREVEALPPELKEVFLLRAHHDLTYAAAAEALGIGERTAKERFRRAREILAHRLAHLFEEGR